MIIILVYALAVINSLVMCEEIERYNLREQQEENNRIRQQQIEKYNLSGKSEDTTDDIRRQENENKLSQEEIDMLRKQEEDRVRQQQQQQTRDVNILRQKEMCDNLGTLPYWNCEFDTHGCGIYNQPNMLSMFGLIPYNSEPVYGKRGILLVDTNNEDSCGARLITPYFPTNKCRYGCLTIEYLMVGESPNIFYIIQQDSDNYCLYQQNHESQIEKWRKASVTVEFSGGKPRFFIETRFNYYVIGSGFVAIANINFEYGACRHDMRCNCDLNPYISIYGH